jgi:hypothetical protein
MPQGVQHPHLPRSIRDLGWRMWMSVYWICAPTVAILTALLPS